MQSSQPVGNPFGLLLMIGAIYFVFRSPNRLQTLVRMVISFIVTVLLFIIPGAVLRMGDPQALGRVAGLVALIVAIIVGWWHVRSLRSAAKETPPTPGN